MYIIRICRMISLSKLVERVSRSLLATTIVQGFPPGLLRFLTVVSLPAPCLLMPDPNGMAVHPVVIEVFFFFFASPCEQYWLELLDAKKYLQGNKYVDPFSLKLFVTFSLASFSMPVIQLLHKRTTSSLSQLSFYPFRQYRDKT